MPNLLENLKDGDVVKTPLGLKRVLKINPAKDLSPQFVSDYLVVFEPDKDNIYDTTSDKYEPCLALLYHKSGKLMDNGNFYQSDSFTILEVIKTTD